MSMRNEMIRRWKERRSASGTSTLTAASDAITRPTTAVDSEAEAEFRNHALPKIIEGAVVAAFSSDNFREAVASMVDPAFTRQHDKLNQLKLANLNLESMLQTRLDELPSLLQPAIDHMTSIKVPGHEKELEKLAAGQDGCLHLLEVFSEKIGGIEQQLQGFDGRMKALEEKVVNADLRSAIRFGEISNELQDRNTTLNDRLWELEREVGGKVDGQQRRIVGLGEDLGKGMRKIQEKISALESLNSGERDEGSVSNDELLERIEKMGKSLSKIDAMESSLRRDIHAVSTKVSALDTSPLESHHRRLEAIERALSGIKDEIGTQGKVASLDSKLLSANNARLDTVASNVTKLGFLLESVKEDIANNDAVQFHTEKLESFDAKMTELMGSVGAVQKHVSSLDTSALTSHTEKLESFDVRMAELLGTVGVVQKHVGSLDTSALASHSEKMEALDSRMTELIGGVGTVQQHVRSLDTSALTSHSTQLGDLISNLTRVEELIKLIDTTPLASHSERLGDLASSMALMQSHLKQVDTTPLSSHSETLFEIEARIAEMRESIDGRFLSQTESFGTLNERISSLPNSARVDSILTSLKDIQVATSNGVESLSITTDKILNTTSSTQDTLVSQSKTLDETSQSLMALRDEIPEIAKPLSSKLDSLISHMNFGSEDTLSSTLANMSEGHDKLMTMVSSQGSETSATLAKIMVAVKASDSIQAEAIKNVASNLAGGIDQIQNSVQEMHSSTMSEIRHKDASILAEVQKSNTSHAEHAARFDEVKASANAHSRALEDGFANLGTVGMESHARLDAISTALASAKIANDTHATSLEELLTTHKQYSSSLDEVHATSAKLLESQESSLPLAEMHAAAIATLQDSVPTKEDLETLRARVGTLVEILEKHSTSLGQLHVTSTQLLKGQAKPIPFAEIHSTILSAFQDSVPNKEDIDTLKAHLGSVLEILGKHSTTLESVSTNESTASLLNQIAESRDHISSQTDTVLAELKAFKPLLGAQESLGKEMIAENNKTRESMVEVLDEIRTNKALMEEHQSTARTEGTAIMEGVIGLKTLAEEAKVSSEMAEVRALVQNVREDAKTADSALQSKLKSIFENSEKAMSSLTATMNLIEALRQSSSTTPVLERIANLKALVDDIDVNLASVTPEILVGTKAIEHAMMSYARTIQEMNSHIQAVKDDPTTSLILGEIGTIKENEKKNWDALLAVNDNLSTIGGKVKDSDDSISKSLKEVQSLISEGGVSRKSDNDALTVHLKRLETSLATSTDSLREDVKAIDSLVRSNEEAIQQSHSTALDIDSTVSRIGADMNSIHAEHLPKLSQDIQAINLSKLNTAAATTEKELGSITSTLDELSQLSKANNTRLSEFWDDTTKANDFVSGHFQMVEEALNGIDTSVSQAETKTLNLLHSQTPLLEAINSSLDSYTTSTTTSFTTLSTALDSVSTELQTITPAVRINSAAISRVDRAVLETGAQIKSVILDGSAKASRELDAALEQIDESLHDNNTRLMGISDFELPRIEQGVKELEALVERELDGGLRETRRNGLRLGVIGTKVVGTKKLFDEMVSEHERREDGYGERGGRSLENSGVLSPGGLHLGAGGSIGHGRGEFRRLGSSRFRSNSNASSGKEGSGIGVKGNHS